ncbi:MAG: NAD(P)/FAD-dependent oxidoreductase [Myxococcota bacterium]
MHIVILGNGIAGMEAALTVRQREPDWEITVISEESHHCFSRTALMWVATGQLSHRCIEPFERDIYERLQFKRIRARAIGIDVETREVWLAGALPRVGYDRLLIACGSRPRPAPWPGREKVGIGHFVSMQDLEWFEKELHGGPGPAGRPLFPDAHVTSSSVDSPYYPRPSARAQRGSPPKNPVVVGGGLIGIEAVEVLASMKIESRFFIREEWFWPIALDSREAAWITSRMCRHGVDVRLGEQIESFLGEEELVTGVSTDRGIYPCDLCVVAIGVVPNTEWLRASSLMLDERGGIKVDSGLAAHLSHDPERDLGIFAAGDCASVRWYNGWQRPEQLWYTSRDQGRLAGRRLLGDSANYERGLWYNSAKLMDIEYTTAGLVNMSVEDERSWFFEEQGSVHSTSRIVLSGDRVVGFNFLGRRWDHQILLRWIEEKRSLDWVLKHLGEASFDTEFVPPLRLPEELPRALPEDGDRSRSTNAVSGF